MALSVLFYIAAFKLILTSVATPFFAMLLTNAALYIMATLIDIFLPKSLTLFHVLGMPLNNEKTLVRSSSQNIKVIWIPDLFKFYVSAVDSILYKN